MEIVFNATRRGHIAPLDAKGKMTATGKTVIFAGSQLCMEERRGMSEVAIRKRRNVRIENSILQEDVNFDSISAATNFVVGGSRNGWKSWVIQGTGKTADEFFRR